MAAIFDPPTLRLRRTGPGVKRHSVKTDMTPMVDLGFLLIAFFVMTTEMDRPKVMKLAMPKDNAVVNMKLADSNALTVIIDADGNLFYYHGKMIDAINNREIRKTGFLPATGLRKIIRDKQSLLELKKFTPEGKDGLMLIIKPTANSSYKDLIDVLDETTINGVTKYVVVKPDSRELEFIGAIDQ